jgi:hypothetical protein
VLPWLKRLFGQGSGPPLPTIAADAVGFSLTLRHRTRTVAWEVVCRISAYKLDLKSHDQVVLLIQVAGLRHEKIVLPQDCPGFAGLFGPMEQALGIDPRPYLEVMAASVAPIPTVLYLRPQDVVDEPFPGE